MLFSSPEMPQHLILACDHHNHLIAEARRYRESRAARHANLEHPLRWRRVWRRLRSQVGDLLIYFGKRLKPEATDTVWG